MQWRKEQSWAKRSRTAGERKGRAVVLNMVLRMGPIDKGRLEQRLARGEHCERGTADRREG